MDDAKGQLIDRLKQANNVLVTVSRNPSVDQLSACIGLGLLLNKQGKHAAAVFSGDVPSTLEFLQPQETLEKTTDSLRDFIISLDKSKADKLRYKVEDNIVRIFITPYKTSISQDDLEFSEGDFNVDVVVALGVRKQEDLDEAIMAHGRILHDATVASLNTTPDGGLGTINWYDPHASSLSELVTELAEGMGKDSLDNQIATALLTGIVSETKRFSNDKTSSQTMSASATLMAAGANQQLVASKLEEGSKTMQFNETGEENVQAGTDGSNDGGTLRIDHQPESPQPPEPPSPLPPEPPVAGPPFSPLPPATPPADNTNAGLSPGAKLVTEPPSMGGTLTANTQQQDVEPITDPLSLPDTETPQLLERKPSPFGGPVPATPTFTPPPADWNQPMPAQPTQPAAPPPLAPSGDGQEQTLSELEHSLGDPHGKEERVDSARDEVSKALMSEPAPAEPIQSLNAQPLGGNLHDDTTSDQGTPANGSQVNDSTAPPPVPPPIPFQFGNPPSNPPA